MHKGWIFVLAVGTALVLSAQDTHEVEITAEPAHHLVLENDYVRVFKLEAAPHAATLMHHHRHDYIFITLGATEVSNEVQGKSPVTLKLADGETRFVPGGFAHIARNLSSTPFRNLTIELMRDEQARQTPPPKWDEERGLHVLNAGTQDILFVKDGVRVTDVQLQPGGVIPKHTHPGPHLLAAVTDLELRSEVVGKPASIKRLKAGEVAWVPAGFTHTVTNLSKRDARFVTLEFK